MSFTAEIRKFFFRLPVTWMVESAERSPKWIKRTWPRFYYHLSLRPWKAWAEHRGADGFLVSFPKCGRTWVRLMIGRALARHHGLGDDVDLMSLRRLSRLHADIPTILVVHDDDPFWKRPEELHGGRVEFGDKKVVFLVRDPRDVVVSSFYHKSNREKRYGGTLSEFLREPVGGLETLLAYYNIWMKAREETGGFLLVKYEDLHRDAVGELGRMLDFLRGPGIPAETLTEAVEYASFDNMRKLETKNRFGMQGRDGAGVTDEGARKVRKGRVGGYREAMSEEDVAYLEERIGTVLEPSLGYTEPPEPKS